MPQNFDEVKDRRQSQIYRGSHMKGGESLGLKASRGETEGWGVGGGGDRGRDEAVPRESVR